VPSSIGTPVSVNALRLPPGGVVGQALVFTADFGVAWASLQPAGDYATHGDVSTATAAVTVATAASLATKVNSSTYTAGLAGKQDVATLDAATAAVVAAGGSATAAAVAADATVRAAFPSLWKPTTGYKSGDRVVNPDGLIVTALADFTSGAVYDTTKWSTPATSGASNPAASPLVREFRATVDTIRRLSRRPSNVIGYDYFDRPETVATLGQSDCGQAWFNSSGARIVAGSVQKVAGNGTRVFPLHYNLFRDIEISSYLDTPTTGDFDTGIVFRAGTGASNFLWVALCKSTNDIKFYKRINSTDTVIATTSTFGWAFDTRYKITVRDFAGTITVLVNDAVALTATPAFTSDELTALSGTNIGYHFHQTREINSRLSDLTWRHLTPRRPVFAKVIAHRSAVAMMPENSLTALAALPGNVYGAEFDVAQTSDGVWIVMHDSTVDRTTTGTGTVSALTSAYVQGLLIKGGGGPVPTLTEFLDAAFTKGMLELHIDYVSGSIPALVALVMAHPMASRCVFFMGSVSQAQSVRAASTTARIALGSVTTANVSTFVAAAQAISVEFMYIASSENTYTTNRAAVASILAAGMAAGASVVDLSVNQLNAQADGCTVLLTNYANMVNV
jgi:hypothetical protein